MTARVKYNGVEKYETITEQVTDFVRALESELPPDSRIDLTLARESARSEVYKIRARIRGLRQEIFAQVKGENILNLLQRMSDLIFFQATKMKDRCVSRRRSRKSLKHMPFELLNAPA